MRKVPFSVLGLIAAILALAGCGFPAGAEGAQLSFETQMQVDSAQRFHVSLGVRNVGQTRYRDYQGLNAAMALWDGAGERLGSVSVATLWELAPGNAGWPAAYASKLPAGAYRLTWGSPDQGSIEVDFTIVELDGWLYLGEQAIQYPATETPVDDREYGAMQALVDLARANLAQKLGVDPGAVTVQGVEGTQFPDAGLGVPEAGRLYAQVVTPGHAITLLANGHLYQYRASQERLVFVPPEAGAPQGSVTIEEVQATAGKQITVRGQSTLPDGTCLGSELWAGGELQTWWPGETCVPVQGGAWWMTVPLGTGEGPAALDPAAQYMLRVYEQHGPDVVSVFAFDLSGTPEPQP